jgi:glycosyltransferase involved in cell wall biosynthesis
VKIGINALFRGEPTGVANYICNLIYCLAEIDKKNRYVIYMSQSSDPYIQVNQENFTKVYPDVDPGRPAYRRYWEQVKMPALVDADRLDLFHCPMNVIPLFMKTPRIVTIIDTQYFAYPEHFSFLRRNYNILFQKLSLWKASGVITISDCVRQEINRYFQTPLHKIRAIHFGIDPSFLAPIDQQNIDRIRREYGIDRPYVLFAGFPHGRKNLPNMLSAFHRVKKRLGLPHVFVIAGDRGFDKESDNANIDRTIAELHMENDVKSLGHVSGICTEGDPSCRKLPFLMAGADVYMFCSLYEGFGLPVLESMACGTPVLTSTIPIMKEVAGEAGVFTDPFDVEDIARGLTRLLQEPEFRADLVRKGRERIKHFNWRKNAEQSLAYYEEVYRSVKSRP